MSTDTPVITYSQNPVSGEENSDVTISCLIEAFPDNITVKWYRVSNPGGPTLIDRSGNKYSGGIASTPSLTVHDLTESDEGEYQCRASNDVGTGIGADVQLDVNYAPKITVGSSSVNGTEPQSVTLTCTVNARPSITSLTWYKGGQVLNTSDTSVYSGGTPNVTSLTIVSVGSTDGGSYYCVAANSVGSTSSDTITLTVSYIPVITVPQNQIGVAVGEDVTLTVSIDANPALSTIQWVHVSQSGGVGTTIDVTGSRYSGGTTSSPSLEITSLQTADIGNYTVTAGNSVGTREAVLTVAVSYPPTTPNITYNTSGYKEGDQILLTCSTSGFPQPQYQWYHNSQLVTSATGSTLTVTSASPSDKGDYRCYAFNSQGNADATVNVVIFYKPRAGAISNRTVTISQTVNLDCVTDANPAPTSYSWTHDGVSLGEAASSSQRTVTVSNSSFLGRYDCRATNQEGTSDPIPIFIKLQDDNGNTGESTEDTGLSTTTLILIIIICIILLIVIILIIVYCCTSGRCTRKDNNVAPSEPHPPPPPVTPITNKPVVMPEARRPNGIVASSASHVGTTNGTAPTTTAYGRINLEDDKVVPPPALNGAALRHGMTISVPGGATPRPHHLPPLGQDGTPVETESAQDDKPRKKKRRRQRDRDEAANDPDLNV